jgi:adenylylsulfate kinase-like enzyme
MPKVYISHALERLRTIQALSPYETPVNPKLIIDTESESLKDSVVKVIDFLKFKGIIK